jgi:hypothetical protein
LDLHPDNQAFRSEKHVWKSPLDSRIMFNQVIPFPVIWFHFKLKKTLKLKNANSYFESENADN